MFLLLVSISYQIWVTKFNKIAFSNPPQPYSPQMFISHRRVRAYIFFPLKIPEQQLDGFWHNFHYIIEIVDGPFPGYIKIFWSHQKLWNVIIVIITIVLSTLSSSFIHKLLRNERQTQKFIIYYHHYYYHYYKILLLLSLLSYYQHYHYYSFISF